MNAKKNESITNAWNTHMTNLNYKLELLQNQSWIYMITRISYRLENQKTSQGADELQYEPAISRGTCQSKQQEQQEKIIKTRS